ncbi:hypothetical protein [Kitasatospora sp. NPDC091207]|uniref:hypothetical protein n=1 Tax=Kitasatospora sp. NPDC091207 TaxID=3364083 RepID=UPI003812148F
MTKARIFNILAAAATVPVLAIGFAGPASADGNVTWKNGVGNPSHTSGGSGLYLISNSAGGGVATTNYRFGWHDIQNSDGTWNEVDSYGRCLTGYGNQAYTEDCNSGRDGTNTWQRWREINTGSGFKLQNVQTGGFLDNSGNGGWGGVYVNGTDWNNDNQRWY